MEDKRYFWHIDPRILEYLKFPEFHWSEILLIVAGLAVLGLYVVLVVLLDRRSKVHTRRQQARERLAQWLDNIDLKEQDLAILRSLADDPSEDGLYRLISDPRRFETRIHEAMRTREGTAALAFVGNMRTRLRYHTDNLHVPVVSTRQIVVGSAFRVAVHTGETTQHVYAWVVDVINTGLVLAFSGTGFNLVARAEHPVELFFLRGHDLEYRFTFSQLAADSRRHRLLLAHQLLAEGHRPRGARLPLMQRVALRVDTARGMPAAKATTSPRNGEVEGRLLELSEGGFSLIHPHPIEPGRLVHLKLAQAGASGFALTGRVLESRPYAETRWVTRCEMRGLSSDRRDALGQLLQRETQRRLRRLETWGEPANDRDRGKTRFTRPSE